MSTTVDRRFNSRVLFFLSLVIISGAVICMLQGCNGLFYYPTREIYATPTQVALAYEDDWLTNADGEKIHLWHLKPAEQIQSQNAVVVHFHGNAENMSSHFLFASWLAHAGYSVVTFDYRGYGRSDGRPTRRGTVEDGVAVLTHVLEDQRYQGQALIVFGQSLGGAVALAALADRLPHHARIKQRLRAVVIEAAFDSYRGIARDKLASFWLTWPLSWPLSWLLLSGDYDPIDAIPHVTKPILLVFETADPVIPFACGERLLAAATGTADKTLWAVPSALHTAAFADDRGPYRQQLLDWLVQRR